MASMTDEQMLRLLVQVAEIAKRLHDSDEAIIDVAGVVRTCLERIVNLDERLARLEADGEG